jgi:trimeric autotransporter adhesin
VAAYDEVVDGVTVHHDQVGTAPVAAYAKPVDRGTAIGAGASVQHSDSTAIGAGAKSTADHQVVLGTAGETISAPGITSQLSKDRQVGTIELVTTDSAGNLASDGGAMNARVASNSAAIASLKGDVSQLYRLNAAAISLQPIYLEQGSKFALAGGAGFNGSNTGFGLSGAARVTNMFALTGSVAISDHGDAVGRVGGIVQFK